jgi:hypothetical protein
MDYQRTSAIEQRSEGEATGTVRGILATDGEASDGHILNMDGVDLPDKAPLLFGHDDYSGTGNLGSWTEFSKFGTGSKLGSRGIRGAGQIELEGEGNQLAWRADIAHMVDAGHINSFSLRWAEIGDPTYRINLPSDHPAFVDEKKATGRKRWGLFFDKWRMLEGSIVTLGADPNALIGRMQESQGDVRGFWRSAINAALTETIQLGDLVGVQLTDGELVYVERTAYNAMLEGANEVMSRAVDLMEEALNTRDEAHQLMRSAHDERAEQRTEGDHPSATDTPETPAAPEPIEAAPLPAIQTPGEIVRAIHDGLKQASKDVAEEARAAFKRERGTVIE